MTFLYDWKKDASEFVMWDAKTMSETPVLRAPLKNRVPNGFHGNFIDEKDFE